jgi:excisionase family DNA binding protein
MRRTTSDRISLAAAARYLSVAELTLRRWMVDGRYHLPYQRVGGRYRFSREHLARWLRNRTRNEQAQFSESDTPAEFDSDPNRLGRLPKVPGKMTPNDIEWFGASANLPLTKRALLELLIAADRDIPEHKLLKQLDATVALCRREWKRLDTECELPKGTTGRAETDRLAPLAKRKPAKEVRRAHA